MFEELLSTTLDENNFFIIRNPLLVISNYGDFDFFTKIIKNLMKSFIKDFFSKREQIASFLRFFSFTKEILNGKVHILCSVFVDDLRTKSGKDESWTISGSPSDKENQPKHNVLYHEKSPLNKL